MRKFVLSARSFVPGLLLLMLCVAANAQVLVGGQGPLTAGAAAPDFTLTAQDGSSIALSSLRGQWVVVFFFPTATDAGSLTEVKAFESDLATYSKWGSVLGVSPALAADLKQLAVNAGATYPLLTDPAEKTAKAYGSLSTLGVVIRNAYLVDPEGKIAQVWTNVSPASISSTVKSTLSLKPPVGTVTPITMSLKPPVT